MSTERSDEWLVQCGPCDAGLPMGCACPGGDPRPVIAELRDQRDHARRITVALEQQVARVEALLHDHKVLAGVTFMGSPFPPAVTLVDLRAALEAEQ